MGDYIVHYDGLIVAKDRQEAWKKARAWAEDHNLGVLSMRLQEDLIPRVFEEKDPEGA